MSAAESAHLQTRGRARLASPATALTVAVIAGLLLAADVILFLLSRGYSSNFWSGVVFLPTAAVGAILARRRSGNPIGWLLMGVGLAAFASADAGQYAVLAYREGHPDLPLDRLAAFLSTGWLLALILLPLPIMLFPDGRLPSRRWRWTFIVYIVACAFALVAVSLGNSAAFTDRRLEVDSSGALLASSQSAHSLQNVAKPIWVIVYLAIVVSWGVRQFVTFRSSTGDRRQQLKWLIAGGATAVLGAVAAITLGSVPSSAVQALGLVGLVAIAALPVSVGVGVLKYRLYEIDRLLSRTLSYLVVTGLLVGVYIVVIALTTRLIPLSSSVGVAASTLAAVALFNPLRRRVQHVVDRRFNRTRYDTQATLAAYTSRVREAVELDAIRSDLLIAVQQTVEPSHVALWIKPIRS
jgi:hypothetical protein